MHPEAPSVTASDWDEGASTSGRELPDSLLNRVAAGGLSGVAARSTAWPCLLGATKDTQTAATARRLLQRLDALTAEPGPLINEWYQAMVI